MMFWYKLSKKVVVDSVIRNGVKSVENTFVDDLMPNCTGNYVGNCDDQYKELG